MNGASARQRTLSDIKVTLADIPENKGVAVDKTVSQGRKLGSQTLLRPDTNADGNNVFAELVRLRAENGLLKQNFRRISVRNSCRKSSVLKEPNSQKPDITHNSTEMSSGRFYGDFVQQCDMQDKTLNVRVYGISEVPWSETPDDCIQACLTVFNDVLAVPITKDDIEIAHRFGKVGGGGRPRPIVVKFKDRNKRGRVLANARQRLKPDGTGISVGEDLTVPTFKFSNKLQTSDHPCTQVTVSPSKWENISYRLSSRKKLINRRRRLVDIACMLALLGILSMLVDSELFIQNAGGNKLRLGLKVITSVSTLFLLVSVMAYHVSGIQLNMVDNSLNDWRLVVKTSRLCWILVEMAFCAIHPVIGYDLINEGAEGHVVESALAISMFLRLFLIARFIVVHSVLVTNSATQSLGALNKVRIDSLFVFKALMSSMPGTLLIALMTLIFIVSTWSLRNCEANMAIYQNKTIDEVECQTLGNAMWLGAITFLTVGFGDVVPRSECGKITSVVTGLLGVCITALLVAVLAHKLEQSRAEKYVYAFVRRVALDKRHKEAAANVIKNVVKMWRITHLERATAAAVKARPNLHDRKGAIAITNPSSTMHKKWMRARWRLDLNGKLLQAVRRMRETKLLKAHIMESAVGFLEVNTGVMEVYQNTETISEQQEMITARCEGMENRLTSIEENLKKIVQVVLQEKTDNTNISEHPPAKRLELLPAD